MNFDNLVEDVNALGADYDRNADCFYFHSVDLQALITQYILADRAQGQEHVAEVVNLGGSVSVTGLEILKLPHGTKLFTRAQPTPAQIAEIQADGFESAAEMQTDISDRLWLKAIATKLRKGEPL